MEENRNIQSSDTTAMIFFDGSFTVSYYDSPESSKKQYLKIREKWSNLTEVPMPPVRFDMEIRAAITALLHFTSYDKIETVHSQHLIPKVYIKNFGIQQGPNTIYLDAVNPLTYEKILIEHAPIVAAKKKNQFYTDLVEHLLSKLEGSYAEALNQIQNGKSLTVPQMFDIAIFMSALQARWPQANTNITVSEIDSREEFSNRLIRYLMPNTIAYMMYFHWKLFVLPEHSPELSLATSFTPVSPGYVPINGRVQKMPHPLAPNDEAKALPAIVYFPLSSTIGLYLVGKLAVSWLKRLEIENLDPSLTEIFEANDTFMDFRQNTTTLPYGWINTANLSVLIASSNLARQGNRNCILFSPALSPLKNIPNLEGAPGITKDKIAGLKNNSYVYSDFMALLARLKSSKPGTSGPGVRKIDINVSFKEWWVKLQELNRAILLHLAE